MFGGKPKGGLTTMNLGEIEEDISTEEELEKIMGKEVGGDVEEAAEEPEDLLHTSDQNENSGEIRFSCETCEEEFNSVEELRNHVRSHLVESEPGEPNQCSPCKKTFETVNELVDHMRVDHDACLECLKDEDGAKCAWCKRTEHIHAQRNSAQKRQQEQAEAMLSKSAKKLKVVVVGDNVLVPVPNVDRAKIDHPNLLAVVMEEKAEGLYRLGTRSAI